MDRRSFIKLTAVTGGASAIAACSTGSPENQLIRFVPDEELTPGIAETKIGLCPVCRAGCGTTVRVMQGDAEVVRDGKLGVDEMTGGTFTITNGGIYGSLMSTPILNAPQSAILGMHAIKKRPVEDPRNPGQIALRPMMYLALSYDHRIIDGAEAVSFLVHIKDCIEKPERLLLD